MCLKENDKLDLNLLSIIINELGIKLFLAGKDRPNLLCYSIKVKKALK